MKCYMIINNRKRSITGYWSIAIDLPIFVVIFCLSNNSINSALAAVSPTVQIKNGTLEGTIMTSRRGREFVAFRGIPYAQPPLAELRFEPPKPFGNWTGVRSAKEDANICSQCDFSTNPEKILGVEDCLYINVYSPKLSSNGIDETRTNYHPVMIFFYGGAWMSGAGHSGFYNPKFLLDHDIVLATVNYRIGPLGFLSTEDLVSPGNQGLKDQAQSIRWVHENIAAFGGDINRITIFGHSAGAASVHYQMISPLSRGLFHRGISQSGAVLSPWALFYPGNAKKNANRLGELLECPTGESRALVDCLKKKDHVDIIAMQRPFLGKQLFEGSRISPFRPVIEPDHPGAFLNENPAVLLKSGNIADIPWMTGTSAQDGAIQVSALYGLKDEKALDEKFMEFGPITLLYEHIQPDKVRDNLTMSIREFYLGNKNFDESTRMNLTDMFTDMWIYVASDNAVRDHLETLSSPVYYYYFAYKGSSSLSALFGDRERDYGVSHGDDMQYLFPMGESLFPDTPLSEEDYKMVDVMTSLWVNFAKSGNPTPEKTLEIPVKWKPVRTSNLEYLHIGGSKNLTMAAALFPDRLNFWASMPYRSKIEFTDDDAQLIRDEL